MNSKKRMASGLMQGLKEAAEHSHGKRKLKEETLERPEPAPKWTASKIKYLRNNVFHVSQPFFAAILNVTTSTVRSWEQGQKTPSGPAARLLQLMDMDHSLPKKLTE
jgi:putative transcriptional regulator